MIEGINIESTDKDFEKALRGITQDSTEFRFVVKYLQEYFNRKYNILLACHPDDNVWYVWLKEDCHMSFVDVDFKSHSFTDCVRFILEKCADAK